MGFWSCGASYDSFVVYTGAKRQLKNLSEMMQRLRRMILEIIHTERKMLELAPKSPARSRSADLG